MFKIIFKRIKDDLFIYFFGILIIFYCIIDPAVDFLTFPVGILDITIGVVNTWKDLKKLYNDITIDGEI